MLRPTRAVLIAAVFSLASCASVTHTEGAALVADPLRVPRNGALEADHGLLVASSTTHIACADVSMVALDVSPPGDPAERARLVAFGREGGDRTPVDQLHAQRSPVGTYEIRRLSVVAASSTKVALAADARAALEVHDGAITYVGRAFVTYGCSPDGARGEIRWADRSRHDLAELLEARPALRERTVHVQVPGRAPWSTGLSDFARD